MDPAANLALFASHVLKDGDSFLIANGYGDIEGGSDGQFHNDTRLLSVFRLRLADAELTLLSSGVTRDNVFFVAHLTNRALPPLGGTGTPHGLIHVTRTRFLYDERMYERIVCVNYGHQPVQVPLQLQVDADFRDMFEVRGSVRAARGEHLPITTDRQGMHFGYRGLDGVERHSIVQFSRPPSRVEDGRAEFLIALGPGAREELYVEVGVEPRPAPTRERFRAFAVRARLRMRARQRRGASVVSHGPLFDDWMERSRADLALLTSELSSGPYPYAGIPWFSTPFGRDAVITALQTLWLDPGLARGVLCFLAEHQAQEESSFLDAAPGKILHERRKGEMAATRELPFGRYYGGVDTTPLFVMLAGRYARRTGDMAFVERLWPALIAATEWIERVCDANPLGLVDYARAEATGLANQGWKDSHDSIFHADGRMPVGPIALVEVQGYAYSAFLAMAALAARREQPELSAYWRARAEGLRERVEQLFWMPEHRFYGIAVDGERQLCAVRASNAGHLLFVGLPARERAEAVIGRLLEPDFFNGWGIRTLAAGEIHYNPMSYHNGSVWPHDTALCAAGLARYGARGGAVRLLRAMFETAAHFQMRLPELFCGFPRVQGAAPVAYPVACLPQAWAAGSGFMLLQACLGVEVDGECGEIHVERPHLPPGIDEVGVRGIVVGDARVNLTFKRYGGRIGVFVEGREASRVPVRVVG